MDHSRDIEKRGEWIFATYDTTDTADTNDTRTYRNVPLESRGTTYASTNSTSQIF